MCKPHVNFNSFIDLVSLSSVIVMFSAALHQNSKSAQSKVCVVGIGLFLLSVVVPNSVLLRCIKGFCSAGTWPPYALGDIVEAGNQKCMGVRLLTCPIPVLHVCAPIWPGTMVTAGFSPKQHTVVLRPPPPLQIRKHRASKCQRHRFLLLCAHRS